jgi:hypothetical protein
VFVELYPDDLVEAAIELWGEQLLKRTYEPKPVRRVEIPKPDGSLLCLAGSSRERCYQSDKEAIPYSSAALRQDLERLRNAWLDCQATRDRNAIYGYLTAVYGLVAVWTMEGREIDRARRALRFATVEGF